MRLVTDSDDDRTMKFPAMNAPAMNADETQSAEVEMVDEAAIDAMPNRAKRSSRKKLAAPIHLSIDDERPDGEVAPAAIAETASESADVEDESTSNDAAPDINLLSLEALLFGTHSPLTAGRLAELLDLNATKPIRAAIRALNEQYSSTGRSFRVEQVAGGYQLLTLPNFGELLKKLHQRESDAKLTKAALETLAIIAYKQPILRADVEAIRGVACGETIRSLMEKHLVNIAGRAEIPGRPILYGTTKRFLQLFGLNSIKDLPTSESGQLLPPAVSA